MKRERKNIKFPLWRKKVDSTLLKTSETPIPDWLFSVWSISNLNISPKIDVSIKFENKIYSGKLRWSHKNKGLRLQFDNKLRDLLKDEFLMTYMRSLEHDIRKKLNKDQHNLEIEQQVPFWEFLDIEFDVKTKTFYFYNHYSVKADFEYLYRAIKETQLLRRIEEKYDQKKRGKINKSDWKKKSNLNKSLDKKNVIYYLLDENKKELYIGETQSLKQRLGKFRKEIPTWTHYRFDELPDEYTEKDRIQLERVLIRSYASLLSNSVSIETKDISNYKLTNKLIDKN